MPRARLLLPAGLLMACAPAGLDSGAPAPSAAPEALPAGASPTWLDTAKARIAASARAIVPENGAFVAALPAHRAVAPFTEEGLTVGELDASEPLEQRFTPWGAARAERAVEPASPARGDCLTERLAEAGPILPAAATAKGRTCGLTVGHAAGAVGGTTATAELTVGNTPPGAPALQISPAGAGPGDALVCEVVTESIDADGDPVAHTVSWTVDGAPATADGAAAWPGDTVEGAATAGGGRWACTATPHDGDDAGAPGVAELELGAG